MKRLFLSIILCLLVCLAYTQNLKVLDLSKGGLHITEVVVEKNKANQFVIICDSLIAIKQIVLNAGQKDTLKVIDLDSPAPPLFTESTTNYTDLKKKGEDTLNIFTFKRGRNYKIEHNQKTWNIMVRKKSTLPTNLYLMDKKLYIGDSCIILTDTMNVINVILKDSFIVSKWDKHLSLTKNGVLLADTPRMVVDDSCFYYYKNIISKDSIFHVNDTLSIRLDNNKSYVVIFKGQDKKPKYYWWFLLILLVIPLCFTVNKCRNSIALLVKFENNRKAKELGHGSTEGGTDNNEFKQEIKKELQCKLKALLKVLPKSVNGFDKNELFSHGEDIDRVIHDITLVEAMNKVRLIKKCNEIREFIKEHEGVWNGKKSFNTVTSADNQEKVLYFTSDSEWFIEIYSIIEPFGVQNNEIREEYLSKKTLERIRKAFIRLGDNINNRIKYAREQENEEVSRIWQSEYDKLDGNYRNLQDSYNQNVLSAVEEAKRNAETELHNVITDLERKRKNAEIKKEEAEKKAKNIEDSKGLAIADAIRKEKDAHEKVVKQLQEERQKIAEEVKRSVETELHVVIADLEKKKKDAEIKKEEAEVKVKNIEESKKTAIADAIRKEKDAYEKVIKQLQEGRQRVEEWAKAVEQSKEKAVAEAVQKEKETHEKEEKKLREGKEKAEGELSIVTRSLEISQKKLKEMIDDRDKKIGEIQQLEKAQEDFTCSLYSVPFAETYSKQIHDLIELGNQIQSTAYSILDVDVDDPYFIMKALSKYGKMLDDVDMEMFLVDVNMASKAKFVFKDSSLATFKADNKDIDNIMKSYFFNQYLEKYINAIMILNESMSGLMLLLPEVQSKVMAFDEYRKDILLLAKQLQISVLFVKVGDMAGENVDLKAKTVDVEIGKPGQILEVENCIIYPVNGRKPQTKIKVTIKK